MIDVHRRTPAARRIASVSASRLRRSVSDSGAGESAGLNRDIIASTSALETRQRAPTRQAASLPRRIHSRMVAEFTARIFAAAAIFIRSFGFVSMSELCGSRGIDIAVAMSVPFMVFLAGYEL